MSPGTQPEEQTHNEQPTRWSERARGKAEIVQPLVQLCRITPDAMVTARAQAAKLLGKEHVSSQTIYGWIRKFKLGGIEALEHQEHRDHGESQPHPDLREYVADLLKTKKWSLAAVHRAAVTQAEHLELNDDQYPTYNQIRFVDRQLSASVKKLGREGRRAYRATSELTSRFEAAYANQIWQCDHHLLDILILNPDTDKAERPWITAIIDDHSRAITGFYLSFAHPTSNSIALALHHAMWSKTHEAWTMCGVPELLYVDNGKDFRSRHIADVCLHFNTELRAHEPYLARSKGKIERWFRTLEEMLIATLDGYVGSNTQRRPQKVEPTLTLDQLYEKIVNFILKTYHERVHSQTKAKPRVRWQPRPSAQRTITHEDVDFLLESKTCTVHKDGVRFRNQVYVDKDAKLTLHIGKEVRVFYHRNDRSSVRVYYRDDQKERYLCTAYQNVTAQELGAKTKELRREMEADIQASRRRLQAPTPKTETPVPRTTKPVQQPVSPAVRLIRYRFEYEESEEDVDPS